MKEQFCQELANLADPQKKLILQKFFKTGKGQYAEGDIFLGITVPKTRALVKKYALQLKLKEIIEILHSPIHEERLSALYMLIQHYQAGDAAMKAKIFKLYLQNSKYINNWDLVDTSAPHIVGSHLLFVSPSLRLRLLKKMTKSKLLWDRRIAVLATFSLIKKEEFTEILSLAKMLLKDKEDLMHKAVGWMLRELGKKDKKVLEKFLSENISNMPRTMLRYAIEKFPSHTRKKYLAIPHKKNN